ncbi:MAG: cytochrome C oxidase subunit IV family protein [Methylomonas sp.]|jgi:cytochrome o ubiquinol oxidase operon protein cyoD|uniref:cytochrome o ubiquinol oxidase subunit IV n=1 Tax=Methylomonas sp. TaxID=418 RepID=UPI0025FDF6AB|nr:cytochrome C oxidase subunit IV family protein [Methylomonas sp.]MCK9605639.1 cytochrome C oxidase subunit IV family protein [Methylomonas sp.]
MNASTSARQANLAGYLKGFLLALLLTLLAFTLASYASGMDFQLSRLLRGMLPDATETIRALPQWIIISIIFGLAFLQMLVHIRYFLHLNFSLQQRLNVGFILFSLFIIFIAVCGTLWIMRDLNQQMLPVSSE